MTRIDHAARSRAVLKSIVAATMDSGAATVSVIAAQTHATLALVEQQRIANLIALANTEGKIHLSNMSTVNQLFDAGSEGLIAPNGLINPDIAAALGIEVAS